MEMIYDESALNVAEYNLNISRREAWDLQSYVGFYDFQSHHITDTILKL